MHQWNKLLTPKKPRSPVMNPFLFFGPVFIFLLFAYNSSAQSSFGIKLGAGIATPRMTVQLENNNNIWRPTDKAGIVIGLFSQMPLATAWFFQPGLQIVGKGYSVHQESYNYNFPEHLSYLELPLNVVRASRPGGNGWLIGGGPAISLLMNRRYRQYAVKSTDMGVNLLVGYQVPVGFSVNLNYTHGLLNVSESPQAVPTLKNRFLALTVGYLF